MAEGAAVLRRNRPGTKAKVRLGPLQQPNIVGINVLRLQDAVPFEPYRYIARLSVDSWAAELSQAGPELEAARC